jgi:hypothetical protein
MPLYVGDYLRDTRVQLEPCLLVCAAAWTHPANAGGARSATRRTLRLEVGQGAAGAVVRRARGPRSSTALMRSPSISKSGELGGWR